MTDLIWEIGKVKREENENGLHNVSDACKRILNIHGPHK